MSPSVFGMCNLASIEEAKVAAATMKLIYEGLATVHGVVLRRPAEFSKIVDFETGKEIYQATCRFQIVDKPIGLHRYMK